METATCSEIRSSINQYLADRIGIRSSKDYCIVTLPMTTVDDRKVSLFVEKTFGDFYLVHDGGKTSSSLFAQDIEISKAKHTHQKAIADRYGVTVADSMLKKLCRREDLNQALLDVAQCAVMFTGEVLHHKLEIEDEAIVRRVRRVVQTWRSPHVKDVSYNVKVNGETASHHFQYVLYPSDYTRRTVAMKILPATHSQWQAERFGFLGHDLRSKPVYKDWLKLAVISKAEEWKRRSLDLVQRFADEIIEVRTGSEEQLDSRLPALIERLVLRAA